MRRDGRCQACVPTTRKDRWSCTRIDAQQNARETAHVARSKENWPNWWQWELDCSNPHLAKRMIDRSFNETDLRAMLANASGLQEDASPGRWIVTTRHDRRDWEIVLEPESRVKKLVVVTAYPLE
jgi:hypothetical protein